MQGMFLTALARDINRLYIATIFFAAHSVLTIYINSSFLSSIFGTNNVGYIYAAGSLCSIGLLVLMPYIITKIGNKLATLFTIALECVLLIGLATTPYAWLIAIFFIIHNAIIPVLYFHFDVFLEHYSKQKEAGAVHGTFLSIINTLYVLMPLATGAILTQTDFNILYALSGFLVIPFFVAVSSLLHFKDTKYRPHRIGALFGALAIIKKHHNIRNIVISGFILQSFYAAMVIYLPIHLQSLGYSWEQIGIIFTIMLTPFVLFEYPLGRLSDKFLGEKEILFTGFIIMCVSTVLVPFLGTSTLLGWAILLFLTRTGASFVEIMNETYFFKKIRIDEPDILSLWRSLNGFAYIAIPLLAGILMTTFGLPSIFILIGIFALIGAYIATQLKDTL